MPTDIPEANRYHHTEQPEEHYWHCSYSGLDAPCSSEQPHMGHDCRWLPTPETPQLGQEQGTLQQTGEPCAFCANRYRIIERRQQVTLSICNHCGLATALDEESQPATQVAATVTASPELVEDAKHYPKEPPAEALQHCHFYVGADGTVWQTTWGQTYQHEPFVMAAHEWTPEALRLHDGWTPAQLAAIRAIHEGLRSSSPQAEVDPEPECKHCQQPIYFGTAGGPKDSLKGWRHAASNSQVCAFTPRAEPSTGPV